MSLNSSAASPALIGFAEAIAGGVRQASKNTTFWPGISTQEIKEFITGECSAVQVFAGERCTRFRHHKHRASLVARFRVNDAMSGKIEQQHIVAEILGFRALHDILKRSNDTIARRDASFDIGVLL